MQEMKSSKGPMNWGDGIWFPKYEQLLPLAFQKALQTCRRSWQVCPGALGAVTGEQCCQAGVPGPAVLAASAWCSSRPRHGFPAPAELCLTPWLPLELLCSPGLGDCVLGCSLSCCPSLLLSCSWLNATLGNTQLPLQSYPKGWQGDLACTTPFSASCATTGFSWNLIFPIMKQTCNKYCFYKAQNHRRKSGKQTKAGSCEGEQFKHVIMNYIKG